MPCGCMANGFPRPWFEPNETGKSTLIEAMRAAFVIRHNTANRLARSYAPHREAVSPQIEVGFGARGGEWQVKKGRTKRHGAIKRSRIPSLHGGKFAGENDGPANR